LFFICYNKVAIRQVFKKFVEVSTFLCCKTTKLYTTNLIAQKIKLGEKKWFQKS